MLIFELEDRSISLEYSTLMRSILKMFPYFHMILLNTAVLPQNWLIQAKIQSFFVSLDSENVFTFLLPVFQD